VIEAAEFLISRSPLHFGTEFGSISPLNQDDKVISPLAAIL